MEHFQDQIPHLIINSFHDLNEPTIFSLSIHRQNSIKIATYIKLSSQLNCNMAVDAFAIDNIENEFRFTIIYILQSTSQNLCVRIILKANNNSALLSLQNIFPAFNWAEREIWDLSGVFFIKHPDLRRILTDYGFSGHPLRKDFPLSGFWEVGYLDKIKQVSYLPLELSQGYRLLSTATHWE